MNKVRVRQAPSPTGKLHIGNAHTFLFNYCFARHSGGEVLLRIEDTDPARSKPEYVEDIKNALMWLGLKWDGEPIFQSKRHEDYLKFADELLKSGDAYYCYHTPEELEAERKSQEAKGQAPRYTGACRTLSPSQVKKYETEGRKPTIRFRMTGENRPNEIKYRDLVYGEINYDPEDIGDFVIVRSDQSILYNLANVVDDHTDEITHVIRGQGHLSNTPRQILIYKALDWDVPEFGHLPDILNPDRVGKLSKRYGAASVTELLGMGYLPKAVVNFLGLLSWSHPEGKEFFNLDEMVRLFSFDRVNKSAAALDMSLLDFLNQHYIREMNSQEFVEQVSPFVIFEPEFVSHEEKQKRLVALKPILNKPMVSERLVKLGDINSIAGYLWQEPSKPKFKDVDQANKILSQASQATGKIDPWTKENIEKELRAVQEKSGISPKDFFVTLGQAISGSDVFLPLFDSLEILGQKQTLERLRRS